MYAEGQWQPASEADISLNAHASAHFGTIIDESDFDSLDHFWNRGINWRSKLSRQASNSEAWIAVYGAGGGIPTAAYFNTAIHDRPPIIDQTLYWAECVSEDEAIYFCGVVNSPVLLERIVEYVPEGAFGDRHLHTLPARAVPVYDPSNPRHAVVVERTRALITELHTVAGANQVVASYFTTEQPMTFRRQKLRAVIENLASYNAYYTACEALY